jgi:hypothetical protein
MGTSVRTHLRASLEWNPSVDNGPAETGQLAHFSDPFVFRQELHRQQAPELAGVLYTAERPLQPPSVVSCEPQLGWTPCRSHAPNQCVLAGFASELLATYLEFLS